jgi:hypothetical protein
MCIQNKNIIVALLPLLIFLRMNAMIQFWIDKLKTHETIRYFDKINLIIYAYQVIYICYGVDNMRISYQMAPEKSVGLLYILIFMMNGGSLTLVNYIWDSLRNNKFLQLLQKYYFLDKRLRENDIHLDYEKLRNYSACIIVLESFCYILFNLHTIINYWMFGLNYLQIFFIFVYFTGLHMMQVAMTAKSCTLFMIVENMCGHMNKKMKSEVTTVELISKMRSLYSDIYDLVLDLNDAISFQIVVPFCVTFIMAVFHIYYEIKFSFFGAPALTWITVIIIKIFLVIIQIQKTLLAVNFLYISSN